MSDEEAEAKLRIVLDALAAYRWGDEARAAWNALADAGRMDQLTGAVLGEPPP